MVIGPADLPQNISVPIDFDRSTAHEGGSADERIVWNLSVIEQRVALGEVPVQARPVWQVPRMHDCTVQIDQVNRRAPQGPKQRQARRCARNVERPQTRAAPTDRVLVDLSRQRET